MQPNNITVDTKTATPVFITVPVLRCQHSILNIYRRERDTQGCIASRPVELVLCYDANANEDLADWIEQERQLAGDLSYEQWLDSLKQPDYEDDDPLWNSLADDRYDEYRLSRIS